MNGLEILNIFLTAREEEAILMTQSFKQTMIAAYRTTFNIQEGFTQVLDKVILK